VPKDKITVEFPLVSQYFTEKNGFVTATKLGTTNKNFLAATKNFAEATKVLLIELNILLW